MSRFITSSKIVVCLFWLIYCLLAVLMLSWRACILNSSDIIEGNISSKSPLDPMFQCFVPELCMQIYFCLVMELLSTLILFIFNLSIKSCGILGWCHCADIPDFIYLVPQNLSFQISKYCRLKSVSTSSYCWIFPL